MGHRVIGSWSTKNEGGLAFTLTHLVTFLNKKLKDLDLIFGLTRKEAELELKIYKVEGTEIEAD